MSKHNGVARARSQRTYSFKVTTTSMAAIRKMDMVRIITSGMTDIIQEGDCLRLHVNPGVEWPLVAELSYHTRMVARRALPDTLFYPGTISQDGCMAALDKGVIIVLTTGAIVDLNPAGWVVHDDVAIWGYGDSADAAWKHMLEQMGSARIDVLTDAEANVRIEADDCGNWTRSSNFQTWPATAGLMAQVKQAGGNISWGEVEGLYCTRGEASCLEIPDVETLAVMLGTDASGAMAHTVA